MRQTAQRWIEQLTPRRYRGDRDQARRAALMLTFAGVFITQVPIFAVTYAAIGLPWVAAVVIAAGLLYLQTPLVLRYSLRAGTHYTSGVLFIVLATIVSMTGGLDAPGITWLGATPIMAMMSGGRRAGLFWLAMASAVPLLFGVAWALGYPLTAPLDGWRWSLVQVLAPLMLGCVLFALSWAYDAAREDMARVADRSARDMRLVLDNVGQGFLVMQRDGTLSPARSAAVDALFGPVRSDDTLVSWLTRASPTAAASFEQGWMQVVEDVLPLDLCLDQLPKRIEREERIYRLTYRPVLAGERCEALVVVLTDVTEEAHAEAAEAGQRELMSVFTHLGRDRNGVRQFLDEGSALVQELRNGAASPLRLVHTLKGNSALFGLHSVAGVCHDVESAAQDEARAPDAAEIEAIAQAWEVAAGRIRPLMRSGEQQLDVAPEDLRTLDGLVVAGAPSEELRRRIHALHHEPTRRTFQRLAERAQTLTARLGKAPIRVVIQGGDVRLDPARFAPLWSAAVHAVRNAVDHGVETESERLLAGKSSSATLTFASTMEGDRVRIVLGDDGRGIDWARLARRAVEKGLPSDTPADLEAALFADGVSTRDSVTDVSGRGVGLGALRDACLGLGGDLRVETTWGAGTRFVLDVPVAHASAMRAAG